MGIIMQSGGGKQTVMFEPVSLTGFYLQRACKAALAAREIPDTQEQIEERLEKAIITILWSALALETASNEFGENIIPTDELTAFDRCQKAYKKPNKVSRTMWKWIWLFRRGPRLEISLSETFFAEAEELIQVRHCLSHYRPQDTARKIYYDVAPPQKQSNGMYGGMMWSADIKPSRIEPSLVEGALLSKPASVYYLSAREVFVQWELRNGRGDVEINKVFPRI